MASVADDGGVARPGEGVSAGPLIELDLDRGFERDRRELALDLGCRPGFGDGDGGISTELETDGSVHQEQGR